MGIAEGIGGAIARVIWSLVGRPSALPAEVVTRFPELRRARWRRGGLPVRVGGWCLGQRSVAAITLWRTIWLAHDVPPVPELLLHELRHVDQFEGTVAFPVLYVWESLRRGYTMNRFEVDARAYAAARLGELPNSNG
jgi:hypothetical protein